MAVVSVTNDSTRPHDMGDTDGTTGVSSFTGGGAGPGAEPDFFLQGASSISRKVGTTFGGFQIDTSTASFSPARTVNMTNSDRSLWMAKINATNKNALLAVGSPSLEIGLGSSSSNYYTFDVAGFETEFYPLKGGWVIFPINPNVLAYQSEKVGGTVVLSGVDWFYTRADFSATSKSENLMMDAIDIGIGLNLVGGDGVSTDGTFSDFIADDEGTATAGRFGFFTTQEGIIFVFGNHWIGRTDAGTTTATGFTDSGQTIVFPDGLFDAGDSGFSLDLGNASTDINWTSISLLGRGKGSRFRFDTETDINATTDEVTTSGITDEFRPGDAVIVRSQSGTETPGVTNGTRYWVGIDLTATPTGITFHTTRRAALVYSSAGTGTPVALTASTAGNGEIWRVDKDPDTRPTLTATGTLGAFDAVSCTLGSFSDITLTSVCSVAGGTFADTGTLTQSGASLDGIIFNGHTTLESEHFIDCNDIADLTNCEFDNTGGRGHAIRASQTGTLAFVGNLFTGYFSVTDQTLHQFDNTTAVNGTNDTITLPTGHGYVTGDPIVYSRVLTANTALTNLTEGTTYYLNVVGDVVTLHLNEGDALNNNTPINLTAGTGNETHALWPGNAAFFNNSGGALTLSVSGGGDTPSVRNALDSTTTVQNAVTLTVQVDDEDGNPVSGARVRIENGSTGAQISQGTTNASGTYTDATYNYTGDLDVLTKVRLKGFKNFRTGGTITAAGLTVGVRFATDGIVDLP